MMYVFKHGEIKCCEECPILYDQSGMCNITMEYIDDPYAYGPGDENCPLMKTGIASKIKRGDD